MSLLDEQAAFLRDVRKLLAQADEQQFVVTGGELERALETQTAYVRAGREKSMDSPHLRRCAITLNFFRAANDRLALVQSLAELEPLGKFWEELDPRNRWGARQGGVLAAQRFERDPGGWPSQAVATLFEPALPPAAVEAVALAGEARPNPVVLAGPLVSSATPTLKRGTAERDAVARLQALLMKLQLLEKASGLFDDATQRAVVEFQRKNDLVADGVVGEKSWITLLSLTGAAQQAMAQRFIGDADFVEAAKSLTEKLPSGQEVELAAIKAVYKVESNGKGFVGDSPKILFEGHVFWERLKALGLRPETLARGNEDILYPKWTKEFYVGGGAEQGRLTRAEAIQSDAARESASWGLFQIMGYHWKSLGYASIDEFVELMGEHESKQLDAFCRFINNKKDRSGRTLATMLAQKDWTAFAYNYNGEGYRKNAYDDKLRDQYQHFKA